jgi:hypothetical protein
MCPWALYVRGMNHSCQKKWIDGFLIFSWDKLKALIASKKVTFNLSGCVKDSTREYWERVLNDRSQSGDYTWVVKHREQQIRVQKTEDGPILCHCSNLCYTDPNGKRLFDCDEHEVRRIVGMQEELDKVYWDFNN